MNNFKKYIFITGEVDSCKDKGMIIAVLASILESMGLILTIIKLDPYININSRNINPLKYGEIFVTTDGVETNSNLGHYERFISSKMSNLNNFTIGSIYSDALNKEKNGDYFGNKIQIVPHITNIIKNRIIKGSQNYNIIIVDLGGVVGCFESLPFIETIKQMSIEIGCKNVLFMHLILLLHIKTKYFQFLLKKLLSIGINPNIIIYKSNKLITYNNFFKKKDKKLIIYIKNTDLIYKTPLILKLKKINYYIYKYFELNLFKIKFSNLKFLICNKVNIHKVTIGLIGKYVKYLDYYQSVNEALKQSALKNNFKINIIFVDSEDIEIYGIDLLKDCKGIVIPGGFGYRGVEGKIITAKYARENNVPYLGICLGMQVALIEFTRNILGIKEANSSEFIINCKYPIITFINSNLNGFMRLGDKICRLIKNTLVNRIYGKSYIIERHRHKYKVNNLFIKNFRKTNLRISGWSKNFKLVEIIEYINHPWFVGTQFHPEFTSTVNNCHPLFFEFIKVVGLK